MSQKQPRYMQGVVALSPAQIDKMRKSALAGLPISLVLSGKGMDMPILMTATQHQKLAGGGSRIKLTAPQLRAMMGMGFFGEVADAVGDAALTAAKGLDPSGGILTEAVGEPLKQLLSKAGDELDYLIMKKPNFDKLAQEQVKKKRFAQGFLNATPEEQQQRVDMLNKSPVGKLTGKKFTVEGSKKRFEQVAAAPPKTAEQLKMEFRAKNLGKGQGAGRKMTPETMAKLKQIRATRATPVVGGAPIGQLAAAYIRNSMAQELKKK